MSDWTEAGDWSTDAGIWDTDTSTWDGAVGTWDTDDLKWNEEIAEILLNMTATAQTAVSNTVHANPIDVDDAWIVVDGGWDDAGGGPWDQPGGTPLRLNMNITDASGVSVGEIVSISAIANQISIPVAQAPVSVTIGGSVAMSPVGMAEAKPTVVISSSMSMPIAVQAHAMPTDVDDSWLVSDGTWDTGGGGIWSNPGGTPLRADLSLVGLGGVDVANSVLFGAIARFEFFGDPWNGPHNWDDESEGMWAKSLLTYAEVEVHAGVSLLVSGGQISGASVDASDSVSFTENVAAAVNENIAVIGSTVLGVSSACAITQLGLNVEANAIIGVRSVITSVGTEEPKWNETSSTDNLWIPMAEVEIDWTLLSALDSLWSTEFEMNSVWTLSLSVDGDWIEDSPSNKEWS